MNRMYAMSIDDVQNQLVEGMSYSDNPASSELIQSIRKALSRLHPRYRIPLFLKDIEGFSQEEIAQILKKPVGTIKARISRGRSHLKKELEKKSYEIDSFLRTEECENGSQ